MEKRIVKAIWTEESVGREVRGNTATLHQYREGTQSPSERHIVTYRHSSTVSFSSFPFHLGPSTPALGFLPSLSVHSLIYKAACLIQPSPFSSRSSSFS